MSDEQQLHTTPRVARVLMTEEAIYGLILVSGMIVVSAGSTSLVAFLTVAITVIVFYAAHVYAGTLGRLAVSEGQRGLGSSLAAAARQSSGMLIASVAPLAALLLGTTRVIADDLALWVALIVNTLILAGLGWTAVARWSTHWWARLLSALLTAAFGGVLILLKAVIHH
ncbi:MULTISPECIES: hypothetical protein [Microbacterium]|uniref:hypothetical protein n=1 Tax=Microbacterium TaxID=33882 RepID=UPI00146A05B9|nr:MULTISPECIES: hypothetical protein [Microbacterium]